MKKIVLGVMLGLFMFGIVSALPFHNAYQSYNLRVFEKNPADWSIVKNGASGNILFTKGYRVHAIIRHLEPYTNYKLIYYGDSEHNDVWPYVTCISSATTNKLGNARTVNGNIIKNPGDDGYFDYTSFVNDNIEQKFWVVLASDVDCEQGKMIAWNPSEYLFENNVL